MRVLGIDIGIRNLAVCALDVEVTRGAGTDDDLGSAKIALQNAARLEWLFGELCASHQNANHCSHTSILDNMVEFVQTHSDLLCAWPQYVVIEAQPAARMKMLAGALYSLIRREAPNVKIVMQAARKKLVWRREELARANPLALKQSTYTERKKAAVTLCTYLLLRDASSSESTGEGAVVLKAASVFQRTRKKDDAADSLLHALHFAVYGERGGPESIGSTARRVRKRLPPPVVPAE